ncbi:MAG: hypothetical protein K6A92_07475 [Lachnospiraceae bacterium]|nr:hypothetical protein [Lachnospiraceae bacterium]
MKITKILSFLSWFLLAAMAGIPLASGCLSVIMDFNITDAFLTVGITCGVFLAVALILIGIRALFRFLASKWKIREHYQKLWEVVLICLLSGAFFILQYVIFSGLGFTATDASGYHTAFVGETFSLPVGIYKLETVYIGLLHGLLMVLGNSVSWALLMQVILLYFAGLFAFLGTRKLYGRLAGLTSGLLVWFLPESYMYSRMLNGGILFLFAFFFSFDLMADMLRSEGKWQIGKALLAGFFTGLLCLLHFWGVLMLPLCLFLLVCRDSYTAEVHKVRTFLLYAVTCVITFSVAVFMECAWNVNHALSQFTAYFTEAFYIVNRSGFSFLLENIRLDFITNGILAVLIFAHLISIPTKDRKLGISLALTTCLFMAATWFTKAEDALEIIRYCLFVLLGATGLSVLLSAHAEAAREEEALEEEALEAEASAKKDAVRTIYPKSSEHAGEDVTQKSAEAMAPEIKAGQLAPEEGYEEASVPSVAEIVSGKATRSVLPQKKDPSSRIIAPLPGPKKRVKKEMDYPLKVSEDLMHYDVEISEDDEFDVS